MASASASSFSCGLSRRKRPDLPLIRCPDCSKHMVLELEVKTDENGNRGRIFYKCPDHKRDGSGCPFWEWEENYAKMFKKDKVKREVQEHGDDWLELDSVHKQGGEEGMKSEILKAQESLGSLGNVAREIVVIGHQIAGHNTLGCKLKKMGFSSEAAKNLVADTQAQLQLEATMAAQQSSANNPDEVIEEEATTEPIYQDPYEPPSTQVSTTLLSQMLEEESQTPRDSQTQGPLPDSMFISSNQPVARPVPLTTATKAGRAKASKKRKASTTTTRPSNGPAAKKGTTMAARTGSASGN